MRFRRRSFRGRRLFRRYRFGGSRRYRFKRRSRRSFRRGGINSTRSRTVRLSVQTNVPFVANYGSEAEPFYSPIPLVFTPTQFSGFTDYSSNYSEFRILKAKCKVHLAVDENDAVGAPLANQPYTYLRAASRTFVENVAGVAGASAQGSNPASISSILASRVVSVGDIRQSRWQRQYYPSDIKNSLTFKFYPYTLEWQGRPVGNIGTNGTVATFARMQYLKYRSGRLWMPMSFLGNTNQTSTDDVSFLGPYFFRLLSTQPDTQAVPAFTPVCTLSLWVQFRGQK